MNKRLLKVLSDVFNLKESDYNENLTSNDIVSWDSLRQMDLINSLEEEFEIALDMEDIIKINSIKTIIEVLNNKGVL
jgi:acyl carrier protein